MCDCGLLLFTPCVSTACYGQNAVLQPYDLPVTQGGKCAKPCKVKQVAKKDSNILKNNEEFAGSETGVTKCVTLSSDSVAELYADVDLAKVAASWATLPAAIKISIIAMVRAAEQE